MLWYRSGKYEAELVAKLGHHRAEVWRVGWNITGTMLASTGDDGKLSYHTFNRQD
jgi:nucleoporin SEH1